MFMDRQYIDRLIEQLEARDLVTRLREAGFHDIVEPMLLYTSINSKLSHDEQRAILTDMVALDDIRFERECRVAETTYNLIEKDPLTLLYNRRKLDNDLNVVIASVERSTRDAETKNNFLLRTDATLIMIDIDHFKQVNDTFGHPYGDTVLKKVAQALHLSVRNIDSQRVYRYGGEEIALLLYPCIPEAACDVAERLRCNLTTYKELATMCNEKGVTASFGVATTQTAANGTELIRQADSALYVAKASGRNCVKLYFPI